MQEWEWKDKSPSLYRWPKTQQTTIHSIKDSKAIERQYTPKQAYEKITKATNIKKLKSEYLSEIREILI